MKFCEMCAELKQHLETNFVPRVRPAERDDETPFRMVFSILQRVLKILPDIDVSDSAYLNALLVAAQRGSQKINSNEFSNVR